MNNRLTTQLKNNLSSIMFAFITILLASQLLYSGVANSAQTTPLIIQSQVKGSQEQPKVIYIMPWQGVEQIIEVKGKERTIELPKLLPIHPKAFKQQVQFFANKQLAIKTEVAK